VSDIITLDNHEDLSDEDKQEIADSLVDAIERPRQSDDRQALAADAPGGWLPQLDLPSFGEATDTCGDPRTHFCTNCGDDFEIGRTCARSRCPRCWRAWAMKRAGTSREAGRDVPGHVSRLIKTAKMKSAKLDNTAVLTHHLVFSPPMDSWFLEAEDPLETTKKVIKECMDVFNMEGLIFYHPFAGDNEDHQGDDRDRWKRRLDDAREWEDDVEDELIPRAHFHVVGCSPFVQVGNVTDRVQERTGWVIKRIEKRGETSKSLDGPEDIARAVTYCLSHSGIDTRGENNRMAVWPHGSNYQDGTVQPSDVKEGDRAVRKVAPITLGIDGSETTCFTDVPAEDASDCAHTHNASPDDLDGEGDGDSDDGPDSSSDDLEHETNAVDEPMQLAQCDGAVAHIRHAGPLVEDEDTVESLPFGPRLKRIYKEWEAKHGPPG